MVGKSEPLPTLRIQILGPPQVLLGHAPVTFTRRKALALLAYLAVTHRAHSRDMLASLLTDVATDAAARGQFRSTLRDLRRQVGAFLVVNGDTIGLAQDGAVWIDLAELEDAAHNVSTPVTPDRLAQVADLYRGEFLAGLALERVPEFDAWLQCERERIKALLCRVLTRLVDATADQGDLPGALDWARRRLEEEPWHEPTHRQVMRILAHTGQREAALAQYETCRRVLAEELDSAPQPETSALYEQLRAGPVAPPTNMAAPQTGFVDREAELTQIAARLADPACRLLTLVGLGGSGKTSLALRAAAAQAEPAPLNEAHHFADGVYWVDIAAVIAPARGSADRRTTAMHRLALAIGRILRLEFRGPDPVAQLAASLHERAVLLVLDNLEHLLVGVDLLGLLLARSRRLKLLVTSRGRLGLPEEWVLQVGGLPLPDGPADLERAPASRLYLQMLWQAGLSTPPAMAERSDIVCLCRLVEGLPLALVLVARWAPALSTATIARSLAGNLDLLANLDEHRVPPRQRSIRLVLQTIWERLNEAERAALRRLSVFQAGFTREAAQTVAEVALPTLLVLGEEALLGRAPTGERYALHQLVRQYAAERLARRPVEQAETRTRHATYYAVLVREVAPALRKTVAAQEAISADIANIRLAWDWAVEHVNVDVLEQLLEGFARWHELQGLPSQAAEALGQAAARLRAALAQVAAPDPPMQRLLGSVLAEEAMALIWQGSHTRALHLLEEAGVLARAVASPRLEGRVAYVRGWLFGRQRDVHSTMHWHQQALALARATQDPTLEASALSMLGGNTMYAGDSQRARGYLEAALALCRAQQDRFGEAEALYYLGLEARGRGDLIEAQRSCEGGLRLARGLEYRLYENLFLHVLGLIHDGGWGQHLMAEDLLAEDLHITQRTGDRPRQSIALAALGRNALYQGDLARAGTLLERALDLSRRVTNQEGIALALVGQSVLANYRGDDQQARFHAEEALAVTRTAGLRREERVSLRLLGHALFGLDDLQGAREAYQQATDLVALLGLQHLHCETATDLARVVLAQGDLVQAAALVAAVEPVLEKPTLVGLAEPVLAYLTGYHVLRAVGDARADGVLAAGHTLLEARAAQFVDAARRSRFLNALPAHRELLAAWHACSGRTIGGASRPEAVAHRPLLRMVGSQ
jgi:DNA-binding SARP family transcriptional activator/predicted ATPase